MLSVLAGWIWVAMVVACISAEIMQVRAKAAEGKPYSILMALVRVASDAIFTLIVMQLAWVFLGGRLVAFIAIAVTFGAYTRHRIGEVFWYMTVERVATAAKRARPPF